VSAVGKNVPAVFRPGPDENMEAGECLRVVPTRFAGFGEAGDSWGADLPGEHHDDQGSGHIGATVLHRGRGPPSEGCPGRGQDRVDVPRRCPPCNSQPHLSTNWIVGPAPLRPPYSRAAWQASEPCSSTLLASITLLPFSDAFTQVLSRFPPIPHDGLDPVTASLGAPHRKVHPMSSCVE
jgi:hypothetical protein